MRILRLVRPSIHSLIALILLLPIIAVSAALLVLANRLGDRVQDDLGVALVRTAGNALREGIQSEMLAAERTGELYAHRIEAGTLPETLPSPAWERLMYESLRVRPSLASIVYVTASGHAVWVVREDGQFIVGRSESGVPDGTTEHLLRADGEAEEQPLRRFTQDMRNRAWYQAGASGPGKQWTEAFFWRASGEQIRERQRFAGLGWVQSIRRENNDLVGVLMIDLPLRSLSKRLRDGEAHRLGEMFIVDSHGQLLADSMELAEKSDRRLVPLAEVSDATAHLAHHALTQMDHSHAHPSDGMLSYVQSITPRPGVNWKLAMVLPANNVISNGRMIQSNGLMISGLVVLGVMLVTLLFSRGLSRRLVFLADHLRQIGRGNFDRTFSMRATRELEELSDAVNDMTRQLKDQVQLRAAKEAAETINESRSAFFARVTHELRTPLNAIIGYAELMEENPTLSKDSSIRNDLRCVLQASHQLLRLINDLLDTAKLEAGRMTVRWQEVDVAKVMNEARETIRPLMEQNGNQFQVHVPADIGCVRSDPMILRQVLLNLLSNAGKFTRGGLVTFSVDRDQAHLHFCVKDTGAGMAAESIEAMFQPFVQAAGAPAGTGLGLSISRQFTQLLGGELELHSEPGNGTTADVYFPASARLDTDGG
ncbi:MAG TPA: sensor histidine kinase [Tepidisphaeraceae bacterium]|jgi:signal transduction histidine kinase